MRIQELLAQVESEYEALQSEHYEVLAELSLLRTRVTASRPVDVTSVEGDVEADQPMQQYLLETLHGAPPNGQDSINPEIRETRLDSGTINSGISASGLDTQGSFKISSSTLASLRKVESEKSMPRNADYLNVLGKPFHDTLSLPQGNSLADRATRLLHNSIAETLIVMIVISNVVVIVVETDIRAAKEPQPSFLDVMGWLYLLVYVIEFTLRVVSRRARIFENKWNRLDFAVIAIDVVTMVVEATTTDEFLGGVDPSMFRLLRVFRLVKIFKVLRFVRELQLLVHGFTAALKAVMWATGMLELVVSMWALIYVEVLYPRMLLLLEAGKFEQCSRCQLAYSSYWNAHMTIWQEVIAGDSWGDLSLEIMRKYPFSAVIYIGALMTIQFAMMNLIFTVIVDAAIRAREEDQQQQLVEKENSFQGLKKLLIDICSVMDADKSGELTLDELIEGYESNKDFSTTLAAMDITLDDISTLFMIMDEDRSGAVSYAEFVNNIYKLKEQDMHTMLMFIKGYVIDMRFKMKTDVNSLLKENLRQGLALSKHMESMMQHVETLVRDNVAAVTETNGFVDTTAVAQSATAHRHMEALLQHLDGLVITIQNASGRRHMEAMVKRLEDLVASTQNMEAMVMHVQQIVECVHRAGVQQNPKEEDVTTSSSGSMKDLTYFLEAQADIIRTIQMKKQVSKFQLQLAVEPAALTQRQAAEAQAGSN